MVVKQRLRCSTTVFEYRPFSVPVYKSNNVLRYLPVAGAFPPRPAGRCFRQMQKGAATVQRMISLCHPHFHSRAKKQKGVKTRW